MKFRRWPTNTVFWTVACCTLLFPRHVCADLLPNTSLSKTPASFLGIHRDDLAGVSVAGVGDVNGDGYEDFAIGAGHWGLTAKIGHVYLVFGRRGGWRRDISLEETDASFVGEQEGDTFGVRIAGAGDVNGDGFDDILLGAYRHGGSETGKAYLVLGKPSRWSMNTPISSADATFLPASPSGRLGWSVAGAGDVNADGYDDLLIGSMYNNDAGDESGKAFLILGKPTGWARNTSISTADASFVGLHEFASLGFGVDTAGDVNGDGFDDFLVSDHVNTAFLFLGRASGWDLDTPASDADASFVAESEIEQPAWAQVAGVGDVNRDGYDDFIIGSAYNEERARRAGKTYLILGKPSGWQLGTSLWTADASFLGEKERTLSGRSVSDAGDVNGDGFDDFLIGAPGDRLDSLGEAYLILGKASGWTTDVVLTEADASFIGEMTADRAGGAVAGAGDVNGDGYDDILIGADGNDEKTKDAGQAYLVPSSYSIREASYVRHLPAGDPTDEDFSTTRCVIDYGAGENASLDTVTITRDAPPSPPPIGEESRLLPVTWRIESDRSAFSSDLVFHYTDGELDSGHENTLQAYSSPSGQGGTWTVAGKSQTVLEERNRIRVEGVDSFSHFSIVAAEIGPTFTPTETPFPTVTPTPTETPFPTATPTATPTGVPTPAAWGRCALEFDGRDFGHAPASEILDLSDSDGLAVEAWIYLQTTTASRQYVLTKGFALQPYYLAVTAENALEFGLDTSEGVASAFSPPGSVPFEVWTHIAGTWDGTVLRAYVNGLELGSEARGGTITTTDGVLLVGGVARPDGTDALTGLIDEVRIWDLFRTENELRDSAREPLSGAEPGLVAYWKMEAAGPAGLALDSTGNGLDLMLGTGDPSDDMDPSWVCWLDVIAGARIDPAFPQTLDDLECVVGTLDGATDELDLSYRWFRDGVELVGSAEVGGDVFYATGPVLSHHFTEKYQTFVCIAEGTNGSPIDPVSSGPVTILNSPPTAPEILILPENPTPDDGLAVWILTDSTDPDGDPVGLVFEWYESTGGDVWQRRSELSGNVDPYDRGLLEISSLYTQMSEMWMVVVTPVQFESSGKVTGVPLEGPAAVSQEYLPGESSEDAVFIFPDLTGDDRVDAADLLMLQGLWHMQKDDLPPAKSRLFFEPGAAGTDVIGADHLFRLGGSGWYLGWPD